ncbi:PH domain-containing protein [Halomicroarcula limicola]|uniref:PH domain-containing protein n=1 Tax=Haloarcula limicola TaxID=1429915 RepID=A0A8J7YBP8_9EURY|nr:PH domain-containing protein [Halomicroarcula limicola]MBV0925269.1 PH domain-containing protein [Halomicroarcula limicola]
MQIRASREPFQTPERLDARFGAVAGLYAAALLSPALLLVAVQWLQLESGPLALGLLGAVGSVLTALVAWQVMRLGGLVAWFNSTWSAVLVPAIGVIPVFAYHFQAFLYVAFSLTELQPESAASLVGVTGFFLGIAASVLGVVLVQMARSRLMDATVDDGDVDTEWTAGWPPRDRLKLAAATLAVVIPLFGLAVWQLDGWGLMAFSPVCLVVVFATSSIVSKATYRVTPAGLEQRREGRLFVSRHLVPWSQFDGFSASDDAVVLHRPLPHFDVRCKRWDLMTDDEAVLAALDAHLDRRDS